MPNGFIVEPGAVEAHAKAIDGAVFARVSTANQAAQQVGMGGFQPYGVLGLPCWAAVSVCNADSTEVTKQAAELGTTLAEKLKQTARSYDEVDTGVRDVMKEI